MKKTDFFRKTAKLARERNVQEFISLTKEIDAMCLHLYCVGIMKYDGKTFTQIFKAEKKAGRIKQPHTLELHLIQHLVKEGFVQRIPKNGGRGIRGKYYFSVRNVARNGSE